MRKIIFILLTAMTLVLSSCTPQEVNTDTTESLDASSESLESSGNLDNDKSESNGVGSEENDNSEAMDSDEAQEDTEESEDNESGTENSEEDSTGPSLEESSEKSVAVDASAPIGLDNLVPEKTHLAAWASVNSARLSQQNYVPEIDYYISPKLVAEQGDRVEIEKAALESASTLWSPSFRPENVQIIYVSNNDPAEKQWFGETVEELGGLNYMLDWDEFYDSECGARLIRGARASYFDGLHTMVACIAGDASTRALHNQPHEYTHFYQSYNNNIPDNGPPWLTEGGATFYGMALAFYERSDRESERYLFYRNMTYGFDQNSGNSRGEYIDNFDSWRSSEFVSLMTKIEANRTSHDAAKLYLFGSLASEALVATYGHSAMKQFHESFNSTLNWKTSFEQIFGVSTEIFYEKLFPYVKSELKKAGSTPGI